MGMTGQSAYNSFYIERLSVKETKPFLQRLWDSEWIPIRKIPDEEYIGMLNEKLIRVDAEIAVIDENICKLRESQVLNAEATEDTKR